MNEFKLIVAGGRDFNDYQRLSDEIIKLAMVGDLWDKNVSIVSGMARGADALGVRFAKNNNVRLYEMPADWDTHGKAAGMIRNHEMGDIADGLLAFWDQKSNGTRDMINYMRKLNKSVWVHYY